MSIVNKIRNAFTGGKWFVAYRETGEQEWMVAETPEAQWCADPFVFEDGDDHYIFVEQYLTNKDKGCIGYYKFIDGKPVNQGIIIENSYHMSYPDVFKCGDQYYMIPESSANNTVDLYAAEHFPDKWKKEKTLIDGKKYVDSTVYQDGDKYYLISYSMVDGYEIHVFTLDMEKKEVALLSKKRYDKNIARPGGRPFVEKGKLMRPAQDCSRKYGEALILYEINELSKSGEFTESEVDRIEAGNLGIENKPERIHQLTKDTCYEVVDVYKECFDLFHAPKIFLRSRRK